MANKIWVGTTSTAWATSTNWSPVNAPSATGDSAYFDWNSPTNGVAGSDQSATTLDLLEIASTYTLAFGDLATALKVKATLLNIGRASNSGTAGAHSGRINLDLSTVASTINVYGTKTTSTDTGLEPVRIKGTGANKITVYGTSRVGIATNTVGDAATFAEIACMSSGSVVNVGAGTTLTKWRQEAGTGNILCGLATLQQDAGTVSTFGSGAITTTAVIGGRCNFNSSGTVTLAEVIDGGYANFLDSAIARTVTNCKLYKGSTLAFDPNVVTMSNPIQLIQCGLEDVSIITPSGLTVAVVKV